MARNRLSSGSFRSCGQGCCTLVSLKTDETHLVGVLVSGKYTSFSCGVESRPEESLQTV